MIFDCFTFFNELDILEMRLEELSPVVDKFIIVEADHTFQGQPKPFHAQVARESKRFERFRNQIHTVSMEVRPTYDTWSMEYLQRNQIKQSIEYHSPDPEDIIILGDADEIPRRSVVQRAEELLKDVDVVSPALDAYYYGLNTSGGHKHTNRIARWKFAKTLSMQELRTLDPPPNIVYDGGWHFSYLGDAEHIATKFKAFAHSELNRSDTTDPEILRERMEARTDLWGDGHHYETVQIDDTWPEAVKNDRAYWSKYEWNAE